MCHIHTSIGNNKILCTPSPLAVLKRYFPASLVAPLPNSEQINKFLSTHTYTMSLPNHIHHHYFTFVTHTHIISSIGATYAPCCHICICGYTTFRVPELPGRWMEKLAGGPHKQKNQGPSPLARVKRVGRQQQHFVEN